MLIIYWFWVAVLTTVIGVVGITMLAPPWTWRNHSNRVMYFGIAISWLGYALLYWSGRY